MHDLLLAALAFVAAGTGAVGGLGGAVLLVPVLVITGTSPVDAAPLGLLSVAAGSLAASGHEMAQGVIHHRLGITTELAASAGAFAGALVSGAVGEDVLARVLAAAAIVAAVAGGRRKGVRNLPDATFSGDAPGEWPGTLAGAYRLGEAVVPYQARRLGLGLAAMGGAGAVAGLSGVGGGFLKTPAMAEIMRVPVKVAAATTTFTVGITAASGLIVYATQGRIDAKAGAAVVAGGLVGGRVGARVQEHLQPQLVRRVLSVVLVAIGGILLVTG